MFEDYIAFERPDKDGKPVLVAYVVPWIKPTEIYATARRVMNEALGVDTAPEGEDDYSDLILVQAQNLDEALKNARSFLNSCGASSDCETVTYHPGKPITDAFVLAEAEAPAIGSGLPSLLELRLEADLKIQHAAEQELLHAPMKTLIAKVRSEVTGLFDMLNRGTMPLKDLLAEKAAKARPLPRALPQGFGALTR